MNSFLGHQNLVMFYPIVTKLGGCVILVTVINISLSGFWYIPRSKQEFSGKFSKMVVGPSGCTMGTLTLKYYRLLPLEVHNIPSSQQSLVSLTGFHPGGHF